MNLRRLVVTGALGAIVTVCSAAAAPAHAASTASALEPRSLARAQTIRAELDSRYRAMPGHGLAVTEATSTGVVESFALLTPGPPRPALPPGRGRHLVRDLPRRGGLPVPCASFRPPRSRVRSAPARARARASHVPRDVSQRRCSVASHLALHRVRRRARGACARNRCPCRGEGAWRRSQAGAPRVPGADRRSGDAASGLPLDGARADREWTGLVGWRSSVADPDRSDLTNALSTSSSRGTRRRRRALCGTFLASSDRAPGIRPHHDDDREGGGWVSDAPPRGRRSWAYRDATSRDTVSDARITGARAGGDWIPSWAPPSRGSGSLVDDAAVQPTRHGVQESRQRFRTVQPKDRTRQQSQPAFMPGSATTQELRVVVASRPIEELAVSSLVELAPVPRSLTLRQPVHADRGN